MGTEADPSASGHRDEPPIESYGLIGDTRTAALVSTGGSVDWLCFPRFDSEPVFGRLVGGGDAGHFSIAPDDVVGVARRYVGDSTVLETTWRTRTGEVALVDAMVADVGAELLPGALLVRRVEARGGPARLVVTIDPRDGWRRRPMSAELRDDTLVFRAGRRIVTLRTDDPSVRLRPGEPHVVEVEPSRPLTIVLGLDESTPAVLVPPDRAADAVRRTFAWWRQWAAEVALDGEHAADIRRSLVTLRLLTYAPSGAPVAAPTTSLPEIEGGSDNWDYRYAWPRDAALNVLAFAGVGKVAEAEAFFYWSLHAGRLTRPRINVLYDVLGGTRLRERELDLPGWRGSRPVRVGNSAAEQFQLDGYGWVLAAAAALERVGGTLWRETRRAARAHAGLVADRWREPDHGIWELRGERRQYVHSKAMAWLAVRCMADLEGSDERRRARWHAVGEAIADDIRTSGFDERRGTYTAAFDDPSLDASLLLLPWIGVDRDSGRVGSTVDAIRSVLEVEPGLVYRREVDPQTGGPADREGAFVACSFWLAQALAILGRRDEAAEVYEAAAGRVNDLGLLAEEIEPGSGRFLGNFPQALSHSSLALAALELDRHGERNAPRISPNTA